MAVSEMFLSSLVSPVLVFLGICITSMWDVRYCLCSRVCGTLRGFRRDVFPCSRVFPFSFGARFCLVTSRRTRSFGLVSTWGQRVASCIQDPVECCGRPAVVPPYFSRAVGTRCRRGTGCVQPPFEQSRGTNGAAHGASETMRERASLGCIVQLPLALL